VTLPTSGFAHTHPINDVISASPSLPMATISD
jgi:hypothetical protein